MKRLSLNDMLYELSSKLEMKKDAITSSVTEFFNEKKQYVIFLSATNGSSRARVVHGRSTSFEKSWQQATQRLKKTLLMNRISPIWVKADLVTTIETKPFSHLINELAYTRKNYFRKGISFDALFRNAFLEEEVNANVFFHNWGDEHVELSVINVNNYLHQYKDTKFRVNPSQLKDVHLFNTESVFHDGAQIHEQFSHELSKGSRIVGELNAEVMTETVDKASQFLITRLKEDGQFRYANFPAFNKESSLYNIIHHANAVYALTEAYALTKHPDLLYTIERALTYIIENAVIKREINGSDCAFVIDENEKDNEREIKLGALAFTLLALINYTKVTENEQFLPYIVPLANGIQHFQQRDGSFVHVLHEDTTVKEPFRIVFYEGQAVLSLIRLHELTENRQWLMIAGRSLNYFVKQNYARHGDPWLNMAINEMARIRPNKNFIELNFRATKRQLDQAFSIETSSAPLLQLLLSTYELTKYIKEKQLHDELLQLVDEKKLLHAIYHRVHHQLNGYLWPEMAMYFQEPNQIVNSFYVRHDSYRIGIDDVANELSSLSFYVHTLHNAENTQFWQQLTDRAEEIREEATYVTLAERYEKGERWAQAIVYLAPLFTEEQTWMDGTYAVFAKALRMNGNFDEAQQILGKANKLYPKSERVLLELLRLFIDKNEWGAVQVVAGDLLQIDDKEANYYIELGRASAELKDRQRAEAAFKIGLIHKHNMSTEQLIDTIQKRLTDEPKKWTSTYTFKGGRNNLGVIVHESKNEKLFTKIARHDINAQREKEFYEKIVSQYKQLQEFVPAFKDAYSIDDVQYVTTKMIEAMKKSITVEEVIQISKQISSVTYNDINETYPNPNYQIVLKRFVGDAVMQYFTKIHEHQQNEQLFIAMETFMREYDYPEQLFNVMLTLKSIILNNQLYTYIKPEEHYSLLHGDFDVTNILVNQSDEAIQVLDWGQVKIGPHFMDMANFLTSIAIPFADIKEKYLIMEDGGEWSLIEQIFFIYGLLLLDMIRINIDNPQETMNIRIMPALKHLKQSVEQFNRLQMKDK